MQTDIEYRAVHRFLGGAEDSTSFIFLGAMLKVSRGDPSELRFHREQGLLDEMTMLRCMRRFSPQTLADLVGLCDLMEYVESPAYAVAVAKLNGWALDVTH